MRIAVIQHRLRATPQDDVDALQAAVFAAAGRGAELVIVPCVPSFVGDSEHEWALSRIAAAPAAVVLAKGGDAPFGVAALLGADDVAIPGLGPICVLSRDACFDRAEWERGIAASAQLFVLSPCAENDLQVEAAAEVALALSDSAAGLVVVAECTGADPGAPGHGGSAIVLLGDVAAEAFGDEDVLFAEVELPIPQPEPRAPLPIVPTLLSQHLAHHEGRKLEVAYPADLSDGRRGL